MSVLLTFGTYDTPHAGHASFLRKCERFADQVVVAVRTDETVERLKGSRPAFSFEERTALIEALGYGTIRSDSPGAKIIRLLKPEVLAIGSDWSQGAWLRRLEIGQAELDRRKITTVFIPYTKGISTTELKRRLG